MTDSFEIATPTTEVTLDIRTNGKLYEHLLKLVEQPILNFIKKDYPEALGISQLDYELLIRRIWNEVRLTLLDGSNILTIVLDTPLPPERDQLIEAGLKKYHYPSNTTNAARSGYYTALEAHGLKLKRD